MFNRFNLGNAEFDLVTISFAKRLDPFQHRLGLFAGVKHQIPLRVVKQSFPSRIEMATFYRVFQVQASV